MKQKYMLFDLDGTLTDPMLGITKSVQYALRYYDIEVNNLRQLCPFIGPPLRDSFMEYYNFTEEKANEAILKYREYFKDIGIFENELYPGLEGMLRKLKQAGKKLMVATSKPEIFAVRIMDHFDLSHYFDFIGGATLDGTRELKTDVIRYVMESNHLQEPSEIIMIGDRKYDINGAKDLHIKSIGVLYGYGNHQELQTAGADFIVADISELETLLLDESL